MISNTEMEAWMQEQLYVLEQEVIKEKIMLEVELNLIYQRQQELMDSTEGNQKSE